MARYSFTTPLCVLALCALILATACSKKSTPTPPPTPKNPTITSLNVSEGPFNTSVTITGTNFSSTASDDHVYFNGVEATITSATSTTLTVSVPKGASTGAVTVSVKGTTVTGPTFTYQLTPIVTTFAGSGDAFYTDGTGTAASFHQPLGIAINSGGTLYVADEVSSLIRGITSQAAVSTIAGDHAMTNGHADGQGTVATFFGPTDVAVDNTGNIFVADFGNHRIRKITPTGAVTTFAGNGLADNVDGLGTAASFSGPTGISIGASGTLYVADGIRVRKITPDGTVSTIAGSAVSGSTDGTGAAASFNSLWGIAVDATENIFVTDNRSKIRKITPTGVVSTFAGSDASGHSNGTGTAATFNYPYGLVVGPDGNLYVADGLNHKIRKITPAGVVTTFAGSGTQGYVDGEASSALFNDPDDIVFDSSGAMYVTDSGNNRIRKIILQ